MRCPNKTGCPDFSAMLIYTLFQDICDAAYPRSDYTRAPLVHSKGPPAPKPLPQQVEEPQDNDVIPCEYCKSVFPLDAIEGHQVRHRVDCILRCMPFRCKLHCLLAVNSFSC